ncbi:exported hypothetical protein [Candidatus Zixiibacteriota bacterium]|nr:exported hypothetical protein [candidate division Zixibacteria bacterium]
MFSKALLFIGVFPLVAILPLSVPAGGQALCGDPSGDGQINIVDISFMVNFIYKNGPEPTSISVCDVNHSNGINILDVSCLINFLYKGGPSLNCGNVASGDLIGHSPCKSLLAAKIFDSIPSDQDCVQYQYDGFGTLTLKHINAGLNCCPIIAADVYVSGSTITIVEIDSTDNGGCSCLCTFDLEYGIDDLLPGIYTLRFVEPYKTTSDPPLEVIIDIGTNPSGEYCVSRCCYPWGQ